MLLLSTQISLKFRKNIYIYDTFPFSPGKVDSDL